MTMPQDTIDQWTAEIERRAADMADVIDRLQAQAISPDIQRLLVQARNSVEAARMFTIRALTMPRCGYRPMTPGFWGDCAGQGSNGGEVRRLRDVHVRCRRGEFPPCAVGAGQLHH